MQRPEYKKTINLWSYLFIYVFNLHKEELHNSLAIFPYLFISVFASRRTSKMREDGRYRRSVSKEGGSPYDERLSNAFNRVEEGKSAL